MKDKTTIDAACQQRVKREKQKLVLQRGNNSIFGKNLAFRGKNDTLFQGQNGSLA